MTIATTVLAFMASIALKIAVLMLLAAALDLGIMRRRASAATRHLLWSVSIGAALVLPLAMLVMPTLSVSVPAMSSDAVTPIVAAQVSGTLPGHDGKGEDLAPPDA